MLLIRHLIELIVFLLLLVIWLVIKILLIKKLQTFDGLSAITTKEDQNENIVLHLGE
ncbi:MAG: hypothetical protein ACK5MN_11100 [Lachnospiraceae bacterium]